MVLVPVIPEDRNFRWKIKYIDIFKALKLGNDMNIPTREVSADMISWNDHNQNELIFTYEGIYTQSSYDGRIPDEQMYQIKNYAATITKSLVEKGIIIADKVSMQEV